MSNLKIYILFKYTCNIVTIIYSLIMLFEYNTLIMWYNVILHRILFDLDLIW